MRAATSAAAADAGPSLDEPIELGTVVRLTAAASSLGAAAVHASAISQHTFHVTHTLAFMLMAAAQAGWAYVILRTDRPRALLAGAAVHGTIFLLWLVSRTKGLPDWVPGPDGAEQIGLKDFAATLLGVAALAGIDAASRPDLMRRPLRGVHAGAALGAGLLLAMLLATAGALAAGHSHDHAGPHPAAVHDH